jgi:hypothetical protein
MQGSAAPDGLLDTCSKQTLEQRAAEIVDVIGASIGQRVLGSVPGGFYGVALRSVSGQSAPGAAEDIGDIDRSRILDREWRRRPIPR